MIIFLVKIIKNNMVMDITTDEITQLIDDACKESLTLVSVKSHTTSLNIHENKDHLEPFLLHKRRLAVYPIQDQDLWDHYEKVRAAHWVPNDIINGSDRYDYEKLLPTEQKFISHILAFFATADGTVIDTIVESLIKETSLLEAQYIYQDQIAMEQTHADVYGRLIIELIPDLVERERLSNAINTIPCIEKKNSWARKWAYSGSSYAQRLIANAIVEGIFFSGSFCAIYWLRTRNIMKNLCLANEYIARDENMHCESAYKFYSRIVNKISYDSVISMINDAVEIEKEFINESLDCKLIGMNTQLMSEYIEYMADILLQNLGYQPHYNSKNPFAFMVDLNLQAKGNFFEVQITQYNKGTNNSALSSVESNGTITDVDDDDF